MVFVAVYQAMGWIVPSLFAAAGTAAVPIVYVWWRRETRLTEKEEALVVALERVYEELRTVTIQEALVSLGSTAPPPVQPVFQRLAADLAQQRDYGDALRASKVQLGSQAWDDCVSGLLLAHGVGERNIREVFKRIASNARAQVHSGARPLSAGGADYRCSYHAPRTDRRGGVHAGVVSRRGSLLHHARRRGIAACLWDRDARRLLSMLKIGRVARPPRVDEEQTA